MQALKQALNLLKNEIRISLLLGGISLLITLLASRIPFVGAGLINIVLLASPLYVWHWQKTGSRAFPKDVFRKNIAALLLLSLLAIPTGLLLGSSAGILQRTDQLLLALPQAFFLIFICLFFYVTLSHSLIECAQSGVSISKALDVCFKSNLKRFSAISLLCLVLTVIFILALLPMGLGLLIASPLMFYATYFSK